MVRTFAGMVTAAVSGRWKTRGDVIRLEAAVECKPVAEGDAFFVEVVAVIRSDEDDGVFGKAFAFECVENFPDVVVKLAGAAVVKVADLADFLFREGFPFVLEIGAADEGIDVEIDSIFVWSGVVRIGEHGGVWLGVAIREMVAGVEDVPEEWLTALGDF